MSDKIITLDRQANEHCMGEINAVLRKYKKVLSPKLTMTTGGISFVIEVVDPPAPNPGQQPAPLGGPSA